MEYVTLSWVDYTLFALMFGLSGAVGVYFGCFGKKQTTTTDYLLGGKKMKVFPVSMSLVASTLSGLTLLGVPAEIYMYGSQFSMMALSVLLMGIVNNFLYLPVFYELQLTNAFDYLEVRFYKSIKNFASVLYMLSNFLFLSVVVYAPSLAFNQVTGFDLHTIAAIMSLICIFYTTIGGLKAVVWADTLQFCVTLCTLGCVLVMGTISVGGLAIIWERAKLGGRIEFFNMDPDPTLRSTFWSVVLGNTFVWLSWVAADPAAVQRFNAVPTLGDARRVLWIFVVFTIITKLISCFSGLIIYAKYFDCDPLSAGHMLRADQILPYYVLEVASHVPGFSGLFVAGLFSTSLSSLSTYLNTLAGICYKDFVVPFLPANHSEQRASIYMKIITVALGIISVSMIFVIERLGSILELMLGLSAVCSGPILGLFTIGLLFPVANRKGALWGGIGSLLLMSLIVVKNKIHMWNGAIRYTPKPLETYGCNITTDVSSVLEELSTPPAITQGIKGCPPEEPFWLYRISFHYYFLVGALAVVIIGLLVSYATRSTEDCPLNPELLSPCIRHFLPKSAATTRYESVEKELNVVEEPDSTKRSEPALDKLLRSEDESMYSS